MKHNKLINCLWAVFFGFLLSYSAVAGVATAFYMEVSLQTLFWACLLGAVVCAVCYSLPLGLLPIGAFALGLGYFYQTGALLQSAEALVYRLSRQYHLGYGWPIIRWSGQTGQQLEQALPLGLCLIGVLIGLLLCRGICRNKSVAPGILLNLLCFGVCFVVNDTVPGTVFVFLELLCLIVLLLSIGTRWRNVRQGNRLILLAVPVTALALGVLFLCAPRQSYSKENAERFSRWVTQSQLVQNLFGNVVDGQVDDADVDLTQVGYQNTGLIKMLELEADFDGKLYLRGRARDYYDGTSWQDSEEYRSLDGLKWPGHQDKRGVVTISTQYVQGYLFVPYYARERSMRDATTGIANTERFTTYSFTVVTMHTQEQLQQYALDNWELQPYMGQYISLPDSVRSWAQPLAYQITKDTGSFYEKAQRIADYVRKSARYDTNTPRMPAGETDFAKWFLENSDTGYCVHFATAATVLLQASGVPARYVTGYTAEAAKGKTVEVTAKQAHAWCEYWLPGYGWTVLEATPADMSGGAETETTVGDNRPAVNPQPTAPANPQNPVTPQQNVTDTKSVLPLAVLIFVLVAVVWGQYILRRYLGERGRQRGSTNAQALARWRYALALAKCLEKVPLEELQVLAEKAKFSPYAITWEELAVFDAYETRTLAKLKKKNIWVRLYHRLILALY